jgi:hypothetical protein
LKHEAAAPWLYMIFRRTRRKGDTWSPLRNLEIRRGVCILAETLLIEFDVTRRDLYTSDAFWGAGLGSGAGFVTEAVGRLSDTDQEHYNSLTHRTKSNRALERERGDRKQCLTQAQWNCLSRAATNVFERSSLDAHGAERVMFTVLKDVSGINHACKPNAIYQWDEERDNGRGGHGQGVLHALDTIAADEEITICYPSNLKFILKDRDGRRAELNATLHSQCACATCSDTTQDALRITTNTARLALKLVYSPSEPIPGDTHDGSIEMRRHTDLNSDISKRMQFIENLKTLRINDTRLADE